MPRYPDDDPSVPCGLRGIVLPILTAEDVVLVRTAVRKAAAQSRMGDVDMAKLVTAASEIARNTLEYGLGGKVGIEVLGPSVGVIGGRPGEPETEAKPMPGRMGVRLTFVDRGPGIPDVEQAMTDGFTTGTGTGLGLGGTRRLMDEFAIVTQTNWGTRVTITKWNR
jgi:serine/threonine-protein kinase RsbT